ncbi:MAG: EAL domain-containing protein [Bradyrhizobium sp.]|uniref:putative bifunctional diguanylate cyclase/phosphodiesterase n=1 Tax=Bradyrhizobium sp. TaxID=376 RepID=UPI002901566B|nr:EAL domain-containing protein [Bradyrhizobium sp.]MDU3126855.1 EAL domain-containing protein [Bradyrhizobium sp.]
MYSSDRFNFSAEAREGLGETEAELRFLRSIVSQLPSGITVQDEHGRFLLVNDTAAIQLGAAANSADGIAAPHLDVRRATCRELLGRGRVVIAEEKVTSERGPQTLLTAHRPVQIGEQRLLLSSSADITEQKEFEDQLFRAAYYDELTGLPMCRVVEHRADTLVRRGRVDGRFALAFLDLDNFKYINDYYGHATGDALLVELAKRISRDLRESDLLSRISGDEFLLLLHPIERAEEVAEFLQGMLDRLNAPFFIDGAEVFASASVGVSLFPEHGASYDVLRQNADLAMYRVKNSDKGTLAFFSSAMEHEALARMKVEQSLRLAILEKRFCCAFQAKVDIRTEEIKGIEALVRLRDNEGVIQAPGAFINLAVELGLIDELTHLVLDEIVKSIDLINETFGHETTISINVAAKQAANPDFMRPFARALESTGFPKRFMVEVTEDAFVTRSHFQDEIVPLLRGIGVGISIDDFGIGYSSLSALADITADEIKIDRSFITDIHKRPRSQGILRAIESLSEALGMTVIAEGIESFEELAYLQAATKIRYAQGYYFSRPIFLEELKPAIPLASEARMSLASRPVQENRQAYARSGRYRR